jgi:hypothetical protein
MAIIKLNAVLVMVSASMLSILCMKQSKKREHCVAILEGSESNDSSDRNDVKKEKVSSANNIEVHYCSTPRNKRIIANAVGLRIEPWGVSNPHLASFLAQVRPSPLALRRDIAAARRVSS